MATEKVGHDGSDYTLVETCSTQIESVKQSVEEVAMEVEELRMGMDSCNFDMDCMQESVERIDDISNGMNMLREKMGAAARERATLKDDLMKIKNDVDVRLPAVENTMASNLNNIMWSFDSMKRQLTNIEKTMAEDRVCSSGDNDNDNDDDFDEDEEIENFFANIVSKELALVKKDLTQKIEDTGDEMLEEVKDVFDEKIDAVFDLLREVRGELNEKMYDVDQVLGEVQSEVSDLVNLVREHKSDTAAELENITYMIEDLDMEDVDDDRDMTKCSEDMAKKNTIWKDIGQLLSAMHQDIKQLKQDGEPKPNPDLARQRTMLAEVTQDQIEYMSLVSKELSGLKSFVACESRVRGEQHAAMEKANADRAAELAGLKSDIAELKELLIENANNCRTSEPLNLRKIESDHLTVLQRGIGSVVDGAKRALDTRIQSLQSVEVQKGALTAQIVQCIGGKIDVLDQRVQSLQRDLIATSKENHSNTLWKISKVQYTADDILASCMAMQQATPQGAKTVENGNKGNANAQN